MKLDTIASQQQMFAILGADQVVAAADRMGLALPSQNETSVFPKVFDEMIQAYTDSFSGVLLAPEISYQSMERVIRDTGVIFPLERRQFDADPLSVPILSQTWGVEAISNNYGVAKLELFFNSEEKEAASKKQLVSEVYDFCRHEGIDLLLEVLVYMEGTDLDYAERFSELQLNALQELRSVCSMMALEYPLNALGSVTITAELDIPWILTMRDTPYELAKEQLRTVLESGARGFMGMEQFLPEKPQTGLPEFDQAVFTQFLQTTGRDRVVELNRIVEEAAEVT